MGQEKGRKGEQNGERRGEERNRYNKERKPCETRLTRMMGRRWRMKEVGTKASGQPKSEKREGERGWMGRHGGQVRGQQIYEKISE